jgi:hypothetical protein
MAPPISRSYARNIAVCRALRKVVIEPELLAELLSERIACLPSLRPPIFRRQKASSMRAAGAWEFHQSANTTSSLDTSGCRNTLSQVPLNRGDQSLRARGQVP